MNIGAMDRRITLQAPTRTPDSQGGAQPGFADEATVWAEFRRPTIRSAAAIGTVVSETVIPVAIRYRTDVRRGWRVIDGTHVYDVLDVYPEGRRQATVMVCREFVK